MPRALRDVEAKRREDVPLAREIFLQAGMGPSANSLHLGLPRGAAGAMDKTCSRMKMVPRHHKQTNLPGFGAFMS